MKMQNKRSTKFYRKNEIEVMLKLGLKPTKNSGAGWLEKEDGENEYILAQLKSTDKSQITIKKLDIEKLEYHAIVSHKIPVFIIQFLKTNEFYFLAKIDDITEIAQFIKTGKCEVKQIDLPDIVEIKSVKNTPKIKSNAKAREQFWSEKYKQYKNKRRG
jgi:Holliday junction resolvase